MSLRSASDNDVGSTSDLRVCRHGSELSAAGASLERSAAGASLERSAAGASLELSAAGASLERSAAGASLLGPASARNALCTARVRATPPTMASDKSSVPGSCANAARGGWPSATPTVATVPLATSNERAWKFGGIIWRALAAEVRPVSSFGVGRGDTRIGAGAPHCMDTRDTMSTKQGKEQNYMIGR